MTMTSTSTGVGPYAALGGASAAIAQHIAGTRFDDLSAEIVHAFKRALLDYLTCAVSGAAMPVSRALLSYFEDTDNSRHAAVVGTKTRLAAQNAALVNGAHTHGLDFDDGYTQGSAHPAGVIFPAVLAAAEQEGASSQQIVTAAALGYDVMLRVAQTVHPATARKGFHNTPIAGVFGAAAAAASIFRLTAAQTANALGMAGSFAGGIREYLAEGAEIKRIHPGKAARDGLLCAEFARRGVTGPSRVFEGEMGFLRLFAGEDIRPELLLQDLGQRNLLADVYFKPYPCCRHYHAVIDAVKELHQRYAFKAADVKSVRIGLYGVGALGHDHRQTATLLEAQMSAPCAVALAIEDQDVTAIQFLPASLERPAIRELMQRIDTVVDPECEGIYPGVRSGAISITLQNGETIACRVVEPKGERRNPMTDLDLERKFFANCTAILGEARCAELVRVVWTFDDAAAVDSLYSW